MVGTQQIQNHFQSSHTDNGFCIPGLLLVSGQSEAPLQIDVTEGEDVVLECRFSPALSKKASTLYWIRTNRKGHDNVAIGNTPFQANYE